MENLKIISGGDEADIWQQLSTDLPAGNDLLEYSAMLKQGGNSVLLNIDIDPGGGFEGGYALTQFSAPLQLQSDFRFSVHDDTFIDELGKFLGLQDVKVGFAELDHHLVIKTNDEARVKTLFVPAQVRTVFESLKNFDLGIQKHHTGEHHELQAYLELNINDGITEADELRPLYSAFNEIVTLLRT